MITCSTLPGKVVCKLVWNMNKKKNDRYLELAFSGIPQGFGGRMLEVPVGTGVLSMPVYETLPDADITCLDYSPDMMERAKLHIGQCIVVMQYIPALATSIICLPISILIITKCISILNCGAVKIAVFGVIGIVIVGLNLKFAQSLIGWFTKWRRGI